MHDEPRKRHLAKLTKVTSDAALRGCLTSPGMGDQKASLVAQSYSLFVLLQRGALDESCWMSRGSPSPVGRLWVGSYIDDIVVLMISKAAGDGEPLLDLDRAPVRNIRAAHAGAGTRLHEGKRQERLLEATIWGPWVDGRTARIRGEPDAAHQLVEITAVAVLLGRLARSAGKAGLVLGAPHDVRQGFAFCLSGGV